MRRRARAGLLVLIVSATAIGLATDFRSPPRYDGAGYSVLGLALARGEGYREVDQPDAPRHAHFPPAYPAALAGLWSVLGVSIVAAHAFSFACTVGAAWLGWRWYRRIEPRAVADRLGPALAANWTWIAVGGAIQSEPLFLLVGLAAINLARKPGRPIRLGLLLGVCVLTRHVGACLLAAVVADRLFRSRREAALIAVAAAGVIAPWVAWMVSVGRRTQAGLLDPGGIGPRIASQGLFYIRRIPDALAGPFIEVATVFGRSAVVGAVATVVALVATGLILLGLFRCSIDPRRRIAGLVPSLTLPLLLVWPFTEAGRFLVPLVPFLLVGAVEGLVSCRVGRRSAALVVLLASLPYPVYALVSGRAEAQRRTHADFDAACAWLAATANRPGPVLTRHPGEVFWQTGRLAVAPRSDDPAEIVRQVAEQGVAYLLIDPDRYANARPTPLSRLIVEQPGIARKVFGGAVEVDEVQPR